MSWTDIYPIFTAQESGSRDRPIDHFPILEEHHTHFSGPIVAVAYGGQEESGGAPADGIPRNLFSPDGLRKVIAECSCEDVRFWIYVDKRHLPDLSVFLGLGCSVIVMGDSPSGLDLSGLWPLLALEQGEREVTFINEENSGNLDRYLGWTRRCRDEGAGGWRIPRGRPADAKGSFEYYRAITASGFGSVVGHPSKDLLNQFVDASLRGEVLTDTSVNGRMVPVAGTSVSDSGYPDWFLTACVYPLMASEGLLTFSPWDRLPVDPLVPVDVEYATWSNPRSRTIMYYDSDVSSEAKNSIKPKVPRMYRKNLRRRRMFG